MSDSPNSDSKKNTSANEIANAEPRHQGEIEQDKPETEKEGSQYFSDNRDPLAAIGDVEEQIREWWKRVKDTASKTEFTNMIVALATVMIALFTLFTWLEIHYSSGDTHTLAQAAKAQADAIKLTHRPWLEPHITIVGPLTFHEKYAEIVLSITIRNGGTAPAISTSEFADLKITGVSDVKDIDYQKLFCAQQTVKGRLEALAKSGTGGSLILPNSEYTYPPYHLQTNPPWRLAPDGSVFASVSGCITYLDDSSEPHATLFALMLLGDFKPIGVLNTPWAIAPWGQGAY